MMNYTLMPFYYQSSLSELTVIQITKALIRKSRQIKHWCSLWKKLLSDHLIPVAQLCVCMWVCV